METILILGVALIVMGAAVLGYDHYSYTTTENILQIGPITATAERTHTVSLPPIIGWAANRRRRVRADLRRMVKERLNPNTSSTIFPKERMPP